MPSSLISISIPRSICFLPQDTVISLKRLLNISIIPSTTLKSSYEILLLPTCQYMVHCFLSITLFAMHGSYLFNLRPFNSKHVAYVSLLSVIENILIFVFSTRVSYVGRTYRQNTYVVKG